MPSIEHVFLNTHGESIVCQHPPHLVNTLLHAFHWILFVELSVVFIWKICFVVLYYAMLMLLMVYLTLTFCWNSAYGCGCISVAVFFVVVVIVWHCAQLLSKWWMKSFPSHIIHTRMVMSECVVIGDESIPSISIVVY